MRRAGEGVLLGLHELQVPLQKESEETKDAVHPSCFHSSSTREPEHRADNLPRVAPDWCFETARARGSSLKSLSLWLTKTLLRAIPFLKS